MAGLRVQAAPKDVQGRQYRRSGVLDEAVVQERVVVTLAAAAVRVRQLRSQIRT